MMGHLDKYCKPGVVAAILLVRGVEWEGGIYVWGRAQNGKSPIHTKRSFLYFRLVPVSFHTTPGRPGSLAVSFRFAH